MWKTLVVDSVELPAKHTFKKLKGAPVFVSSWNESWAKIKAREDVQETHFFDCMQEETFHNWKMRAIIAVPEHRGFTSLIIAVRFLSVNSRLLT